MTWYNELDRLGVERENAFMKTYTYAGDYSNIETRDPLLEEGILSGQYGTCLLYTSPSPRDRTRSRMPSSA